MIGLYCLWCYYSCMAASLWWIRNYGRCSSIVGPSFIQSQVASSCPCCYCSNCGRSGELPLSYKVILIRFSHFLSFFVIFLEWHIRVVARSPSASQVQRDERRSSQRETRILLRPRRLAALQETPRSQATRCHRRRQRSPSRPHRSLPAPVSDVILCNNLQRCNNRDVVWSFCRFYLPLILLLCFALPAIVPWYFWGESLKTAFFCASIFRYILTLNVTWLVNSAAHIWGPHPYDK